MKIMSKIFSIALVVIMLLSTFAVVAAVPASAENEPVYLHKFTESNFAGWVNSVGINNVVDEVTETGTLEYYEDGSFKIKKPIDYCGAIVDFDLTAEAAEAYKTSTDGVISFKAYLAKSRDAEGYQHDSQFRIFIVYKDGTSKEVYNFYPEMYQSVNPTFKMVDADGNVLKNLDNVKGFRIDLYHWVKYDSEIIVSGFVVGKETAPAITGVQTIDDIEFDPDADSMELVVWDKNYVRAYSNGPSKYTFGTDFYDHSSYKMRNTKGSVYLKNINASVQTQMCFFLDDDQANKALAFANQEGGSHTASITFYVDKILCADGPVEAELELSIETFDGVHHTVGSQWVNAGETVTFNFDTSEFEINTIKSIRFALQNYWFYIKGDETRTCYDRDWPEGLGYGIYCDKDGNQVGTTKDGKEYVSATLTEVEYYVSPITVAGKNPQATTTAPSTTTTAAQTTAEATEPEDLSYEYAGEHFFDFNVGQTYESIGNCPNKLLVLDDNGFTTYEMTRVNNPDYDPADSDTKYLTTYVKDYWKGTDEYKKIYATSKESLAGAYQFGYQQDLGTTHYGDVKQYQQFFFPAPTFTDLDGNIVQNKPYTDEEYNLYEQMQTALDHAMNHPDPKMRGLLAIDVYVESGKNPHKGMDKLEDCSVQMQITLRGVDDLFDTQVAQYVNVGQRKTLYIDVSGLGEEENGASLIRHIHIAAQNYANTYQPESGKVGTCGVLDVEVYFSAIYVPGISVTSEDEPVIEVDTLEADKIAELFKQIEGKTSQDDYATYEEFEILDQFVTLYINTTDVTREYLATEYGITDEVYAEYMYLWMDFDISRFSSPATGALPLPLAAMALAVAAGYVVIRTKKQG